ncbi:MAG: helix-turn-helix domain-containing protein [Micrococcales bacterium]|nr:helix-turn-helix domain-containing protein [Micrococcales bacterium]
MPLTAHAMRTRRGLLGLSQRDLAERSGVKQPQLSAIESGRRQPTAAVEAAVEQHLRVPPSVMLASMRPKVLELITRHRGKAGYVFGSVAKGTDSWDSDLDVMVEFDQNADITDLLALEEELSSLLAVSVDVVSMGSSSRFVQSIRHEAVPL